MPYTASVGRRRRWIPLPGGEIPFKFEIEYADLRNDAGEFAKGGGPGRFRDSRFELFHDDLLPVPLPREIRLLGEICHRFCFPWTTGTVEVTALSGPQATVLKRTGYDNRLPNGVGSVQLVSPMLTRWKNSLGGD